MLCPLDTNARVAAQLCEALDLEMTGGPLSTDDIRKIAIDGVAKRILKGSAAPLHRHHPPGRVGAHGRQAGAGIVPSARPIRQAQTGRGEWEHLRARGSVP